MTNIFLIRHGQTQWNLKKLFRGWVDIALSPVGIRQAEATAKVLSGFNIDAVYSSPLSRARQTARIIARPHGLGIACLDGLKDLNFGHWQGLPHQKVRKQWPEIYGKWLRKPHKIRIPGGETLDEVRRRSRSALDQILTRHDNGTVAVVSHRVVNKVLLCALLNLDNSYFWQIKQDPCAINLLCHRNGSFILCLLNDTCHLEGIAGLLDTLDF